MKQTLFLTVGYPGAGKTTISRMICELTGAVHLWADYERKQRFTPPSYSHEENVQLYAELNVVAEQLLKQGKSVVYDTNFNMRKDRDLLGKIAAQHGAETVVVWVRTSRKLSKQRATQNAHTQQTRILGDMPPERFTHIANGLEKPSEDEHVIELNGEHITEWDIQQALARA